MIDTYTSLLQRCGLNHRGAKTNFSPHRCKSDIIESCWRRGFESGNLSGPCALDFFVSIGFPSHVLCILVTREVFNSRHHHFHFLLRPRHSGEGMAAQHRPERVSCDSAEWYAYRPSGVATLPSRLYQSTEHFVLEHSLHTFGYQGRSTGPATLALWLSSINCSPSFPFRFRSFAVQWKFIHHCSCLVHRLDLKDIAEILVWYFRSIPLLLLSCYVFKVCLSTELTDFRNA